MTSYFSSCLLRKLLHHKHIWCHFEAIYAHCEKVSLLLCLCSSCPMNSSRLCSVLLCRKVNSFLNKMNPTEEQMAEYINTVRDKQWPEFKPEAPPPPRTDEERNETRERAHSLINARCGWRLSGAQLCGGWLVDLKCIMCFLFRFEVPHPEENRHGLCF